MLLTGSAETPLSGRGGRQQHRPPAGRIAIRAHPRTMKRGAVSRSSTYWGVFVDEVVLDGQGVDARGKEGLQRIGRARDHRLALQVERGVITTGTPVLRSKASMMPYR